MSQIPDGFVDDPALLLRIRTNNVKEIIERRRSSLGLALNATGELNGLVNGSKDGDKFDGGETGASGMEEENVTR